MGKMDRDRARIAALPMGEPCAGCACRPGTEANRTAQTRADLAEALQTGEPFYCHESVARADPNGAYHDRRGKKYSWVPESQWRICRGFIARMRGALAAESHP
jgi:hypothetical protein